MRGEDGNPLDLALAATNSLKMGTWESVETIAILVISARARPEARTLLTTAREASMRLKVGNWESVRALAWLARAEEALDQPS